MADAKWTAETEAAATRALWEHGHLGSPLDEATERDEPAAVAFTRGAVRAVLEKTGSWPTAPPATPSTPIHGGNSTSLYQWKGPAKKIAGYRRRRIMSVLPPVRCGRRRTTNGEPCDRYVILGATVCWKHGGATPQVRAVAERRVMLAEAIANLPHRHPFEVIVDALHVTDVLARHTQAQLSQQELTVDLLDAMLDSIKAQAGMAKLALDSGIDPERWTAQEVNRRFGDTVAEICREMARQLGHDPAGEETSAAFEAALQRVVYGKGRRKAIGGGKS